jgi:hypothetical protein
MIKMLWKKDVYYCLLLGMFVNIESCKRMQGCDTNVFVFQLSHVEAKVLITQKKV